MRTAPNMAHPGCPVIGKARRNKHGGVGMPTGNESDHRTAAESYANVSELNEWRRVKVDPMLDKHQALLIDGRDGQPSVLLSQGLLHGKFDTLIGIGKVVVVLIGIFGTLISLFEIGGPWIRQRLGLPVSVVQPVHVSEYKPPPETSHY